eukprot:GHUV01054639.1.p1 GENE.GHUV01054639.1~~GHUV01054639.1.p1  ORF type:complete len:165 (+),score=19.27 GHUV01054639.1:44-538(+)
MPSLRNWRPISYTRSMPPTTSIFRYSSGAMRMYSYSSRKRSQEQKGVSAERSDIGVRIRNQCSGRSDILANLSTYTLQSRHCEELHTSCHSTSRQTIAVLSLTVLPDTSEPRGPPTCMSRSLWYVTNGFAAAPPGIMFIMGVSTSRKPRSSRKRLTNWMILLRV